MRIITDVDVRGDMMQTLNELPLYRIMTDKYGEVAYFKFGICGLKCVIEFPSDWHEEQLVWVTVGLGLFKFGFSFPWYKVVPDHCQCEGAIYGFSFFEDILIVNWGNRKGTHNDPEKVFHMPWYWNFVEHKILSEPETHDFTYILKSGEIQKRTATIFKESREWKRSFWLPSKLYRETISIDFDQEVGEKSGSWKGGVLGCGYELLPNESPLQCLRRMEHERKL